MSAFAFVNLSFIPWGSVECVTAMDYYDKLLLIFLVPLMVIALLIILPLVALWFQNRFDFNDDEHARANRSQNRRKIVKLVVFALFLMYPAISQQVLSFFICRSVDGKSYLVADFTLYCNDARWNQNLPLAIVAVIMYPVGIPVYIFISLWRLRKRLKMPHVVVSWGIVYEAYTPQLWWFELVDMLAKLFLTSIIGFFDSSAQLPVGMGICGTLAALALSPHPHSCCCGGEGRSVWDVVTCYGSVYSSDRRSNVAGRSNSSLPDLVCAACVVLLCCLFVRSLQPSPCVVGRLCVAASDMCYSRSSLFVEVRRTF